MEVPNTLDASTVVATMNKVILRFVRLHIPLFVPFAIWRYAFVVA